MNTTLKLATVSTIAAIFAIVGCVADPSPTDGAGGGDTTDAPLAPSVKPQTGPIDPDCCHDVPGGGFKCTC